MSEQNYARHTRWVTGFHLVLGPLLILGTVVAMINVFRQWSAGHARLTPLLIMLLFDCCIFLFWYSRQFAVKVQDRAIRAEENLRYFALTGKRLDSMITIAQVIALRFAPDEEFIELAERAAKERLSPKEIKAAIKQWRADHHRA